MSPRNNLGQIISRECPICRCGTLQREGQGLWRCDGLVDPENDNLPLEACSYAHEDYAAQHPAPPTVAQEKG